MIYVLETPKYIHYFYNDHNNLKSFTSSVTFKNGSETDWTMFISKRTLRKALTNLTH